MVVVVAVVVAVVESKEIKELKVRCCGGEQCEFDLKPFWLWLGNVTSSSL